MCFCLHFWPVSAYRFFLRLRRRWGWSGTPHRGFFIHLQVKRKKNKQPSYTKSLEKRFQRTQGVTGRLLRDGQCWPQEGFGPPCQAYPLHRALLPISAGNPHTSAHQNHFKFPVETQIPDQVVPMLDKSLMMIMQQETQTKITAGCALGSSSPITYWIHSPFGKVVLCHWKKKSSSYLSR